MPRANTSGRLVEESPGPPVSVEATIDALVEESKRDPDFPLRYEFLQRRANGNVHPGRLASLVSAGDRRALLLFLMLATKASSEPWSVCLAAPVWARALGLPLPASDTARSTVSKVWLRLERHRLVRRTRKDRKANVYLLREDGSGAAYTLPAEAKERYFRIPTALWRQGPAHDGRWYQVLSLPELAVLLIGLSLGDRFRLPHEEAPKWYGISPDTAARGLRGLEAHGLLSVEQRRKPAPLTTVGFTTEYRYTLQPPFGPVGHESGSPPKRPKHRKRATGSRRPPGSAGSRRDSRGLGR